MKSMRDFIMNEINAGFLSSTVLDLIAGSGVAVTDDNQLLSYGVGRSRFMLHGLHDQNRRFLQWAINHSAKAD